MGHSVIRLEFYLSVGFCFGLFSHFPVHALFCTFLDTSVGHCFRTFSSTRACWKLARRGNFLRFYAPALFPVAISRVLAFCFPFRSVVCHFLGHISCIPPRVAELVFGLSVEAGLGGGSNCESRAAGWVSCISASRTNFTLGSLLFFCFSFKRDDWRIGSCLLLLLSLREVRRCFSVPVQVLRCC